MLKAFTSEGASFGSEEKRNGDSLNAPQKCFPLCRLNPDMRGDELTPLGGVDDDDFAERPVSLVVVHPNLHFKSSQGWECLVPVFVHGGVGRGHHLLLPASGSVGAECNDIPKALAVLELLRHGLGTLEGE